jgi:hypothetical protein
MKTKTKAQALLESSDSVKPSDIADYLAELIWGEFGISTCNEGELNDIIYLNKANSIARRAYGEDGFLACSEDEIKKILNVHPDLLKKSALARTKEMLGDEPAQEDTEKLAKIEAFFKAIDSFLYDVKRVI